MTTEIGKQPKRWWHTTDEIIEKWLKDRQALLVLYYQLFENTTKPSLSSETATLTQFCEALIDYVSFGHFRVFEKLAEVEVHLHSGRDSIRLDNTDVTQELDKNLIVNILRTTLKALDFNDKYAELPQKNSLDFENDLSILGEHLAHRLDWEDELVNKYLSTTRQVRTIEMQTSN